MMWLLLVAWMVIAVIASTVFGRVLSVSGRHHPPMDMSPVAPVTAPQAPLGTF